MNWQLHKVDDIDCTMDDSGVYVVINRVEVKGTHKEYSGMEVHVRADLMQSADDEPIVSFEGRANAVRKHLIAFIYDHYGAWLGPSPISLEHASYIGYELHRAQTVSNYVQD